MVGKPDRGWRKHGIINPWRWRLRAMKQKQKRNAKRRVAKSVLRLPDLEVAKSAVLNSLSCPDAQRGYRHAIDEFVEWYCSEPRLSFSKTVVLRYRMHLETRNLAPGTINLRLGARQPKVVPIARPKMPSSPHVLADDRLPSTPRRLHFQHAVDLRGLAGTARGFDVSSRRALTLCQ